jgi:acyl-CoA thioester hydrolase
MDVLWRTEVTQDQIDHLGHMNVRYYGAHARVGAERLLASIGLEPDEGRTLFQRDTYVRHHREQLVGALLEVRGGVLDATTERVRLYEELTSSATEEVAATFVLSFEAADRLTREPMPLTRSVLEGMTAATAVIPDHGRPRTISLDEDVIGRGPSYDEVRRLELAMRHVRTVDAVECDESGFVHPLNLPSLVWGGDPMPGRAFRPLEPLPGGGQMGFATMETRGTWARLPRAGDRVQSFGAQLDIQSKTMLTRHWLFDVDCGELVGVFSVVNLAFDTAVRRSIVIPDEVRRRMTDRAHPELAPDPPGS